MAFPRTVRAAIVAIALLGAGGCDVFDDLSDRFKTCEDTVVVMTNDPQTRGTISMIAPDEVFGDQAVLASGHSREVSLCLERGDRKRFRVAENGVEIAAVNCVASLANYETARPTVVWIKDKIRCDNW